MKILIRNLSRSTSETELQELFENYGSLQYCTVVMDEKTQKSKGFAFIEMPKPSEAKAAIKNLNGKSIDNSIIRVKKA